jgi:uncharacterized RDD family membrane protein YckC
VQPEIPDTNTAVELPLASIVRRIVANVIDGTLLMAVALLLSALFGDLSVESMSESDGLQVGVWALGVAYQVLLIAQTGQTIGKRLMSIQAVDASSGDVPTLNQSVRRAAPQIGAQIPFVGFLAGLLPVPALWHPRRQGLHDRFANTIVVDRRGLAAPLT